MGEGRYKRSNTFQGILWYALHTYVILLLSMELRENVPEQHYRTLFLNILRWRRNVVFVLFFPSTEGELQPVEYVDDINIEVQVTCNVEEH